MGNGTPIEENVSFLKKLLEESEHTFVCVTSQKEHPLKEIPYIKLVR